MRAEVRLGALSREHAQPSVGNINNVSLNFASRKNGNLAVINPNNHLPRHSFNQTVVLNCMPTLLLKNLVKKMGPIVFCDKTLF